MQPNRGCWFVSIPFKRERLSERKMLLEKIRSKGAFQFPSNGKGFPNVTGNSEPVQPVQPVFQFPSNGKGFPNMWATYGQLL